MSKFLNIFAFVLRENYPTLKYLLNDNLVNVRKFKKIGDIFLAQAYIIMGIIFVHVEGI